MKKVKAPKYKISPRTLELMAKKKIKVRNAPRKAKYLKEYIVDFFHGYDMFENSIFIRPYIQQYYQIDIKLLELLMYLGPRQFFTQQDYSEIPKQFRFRSVKYLLERDFITIVTTGLSLGQNLYRISTKGMNIVRHYYELLSGENDLHVAGRNPWLSAKANTIDKKRLALSKKIRALGPPEKKKSLYL